MILIQDDIFRKRKFMMESKKMQWPWKKLRRWLVLITMLAFTVVLMFVYVWYPAADQLTQNGTSTDPLSYLVNTPFCKIPYVDPYDASIRHIVKKTSRRECSGPSALTFQVDLELRINWTAAYLPPYNGSLQYCSYIPLHRPVFEPTHNNYMRYLMASPPFTESIVLKHEFVKVNCYDSRDRVIYFNYHAFIQRNMSADSMYDQRFQAHKVDDRITASLNVMMIGMDSVSRLSFHRQMLKTKEFLQQDLGAFDMMGYNKVADNTFINIVPMTLGKFASEMPWDDSQTTKTFDEFDFIWKQYAKKGYRTLYAEDAPDIAIFDFLKAGFRTPPADHFNRPMSIAMEIQETLWSNNHHCFRDRLETEIVLQYLTDFFETYKSDPHFTFTFITRLSHDDVNSAGAADEPYYKFFKNLYDKGLIENTVIFFFSDHGMRFGAIRETYIGKLEERLPFMYVVVPKWLQQSYPDVVRMLKMNQNRLSTPFDVYETLKDILYFDSRTKEAEENSRGVSWFRKIPRSRSCDSAAILPHWCACLRHVNLKTDEALVVKASFAVLKQIEKELVMYKEICEDLTLHYIREAVKLEQDGDVSESTTANKIANIQVVIETVPGNALFEGTVRMDVQMESADVIGDISRINMYGHQSDCIDVFRLKKFCQCK